MPFLTEDQIDDLLYFARTNSRSDLEPAIREIARSSTNKTSDIEICAAATEQESGNGILHYAAANGHIDIIKYILTLSSPVSTTETSTLVPSETVSSTGSETKLVNAQNKAGNTPLHWASLNGHVEVVRLLLENEADPRVLNSAGHDALFEEEVNERDKVVDVLLKEGGLLEEVVGGGDGEGEGDVEDEEVEEGEESSKDDVNEIADKVERLDTGS